MPSSFKRPLVCALAIATSLALTLAARPVAAQGVTTSSMTGTIVDAQGAVVPGATVIAVHVPSGTTYEAVTQGDGRFFIQGMRVGGPYKVTASLEGFGSEVQENITLSLGIAQDLKFTLKPAAVTETVVVVGKTDPVFSSSHTGASTAVLREELAAMPTITGKINDMARLSPQYTGSGTFAGQDARMNNITIDGAYFNNSFGLRNQPGDTSGVAPISLEAIEQVQVAVAPFDVRQGNFIGAGVNTVTRSGTNNFTGSVYHRMRNESYVGKTAAGNSFNPGTFDTTNTGEWAGGPIVANKLFFFESFENQQDKRPLSTYVANPGGAPAVGNMTRVLASDLDNISSFLQSNFKYATGPYQAISKNTPGKPFLVKGDYNLNNSNKISVKYNQLISSTDVALSNSSSLGFGRASASSANTSFLGFQNSNYSILENIHSGIGEWNSVIGNNMANNLIVGFTKQDESRGDIGPLFPFVDILKDGNTYTSFGSEPFTPDNKLIYHTFQAQDSFTKYGAKHALTFGGSIEKYHSDNSFYPGIQSAFVYNSIDDFYADANAYLNHTVSPVTVRRFQIRYSNIPGASVPPFQQLDVWYTGAYAQDEWRPRSNVTVTAGVRVDVAKFGATGFDNPAVDALTFRDQSGNAAQYNTGALPKASPLWSPRVGFNWDVLSDQSTQVRGGTGVFTGKPAYVWISNQIGNTGMLTGFIQADNTTAYHFNPNVDSYKPAATGQPPASADVAVTDANFKFPQLWRSNIAIDRKIPLGLIATGEFIYNRDVNGMAYINANLPAAQTSYAGADARPKWTSNRINNAPGNQVVENIVLMNQGVGRYTTTALSVTRPMTHGFQAKGGYSYGVSKNTVDPGSIAAGSWTGNAITFDPNNPALGYSSNSPGHRVFLSTSYTRRYFGWGATTVAAFFNAQTGGNSSYVFSGDANGDAGTGNDLIYIPRDPSEMNFKTLNITSAGQVVKTFTPDQQAQAFEAYIQQDEYLRTHRGQYAQRGAVFYPMVKRIDLSLMQDIFTNVGKMRHSGQIRLDITNFGNLLNHDWGVGRSMVQNRILTSPSTDAQGRLTYNLATVGSGASTQLIGNTFQTTAGINDVYVMMLSFRYTFQ